jgi:uncharacterized LabA/DUF88 family protein
VLSCDSDIRRTKREISLPDKIAVLIDAENISPKHLPALLEEIPRHGEVILKAVYGDWHQAHMQKWHQLAAANDFKIRHQPSGKNATDIKLMLDAMDVLRFIPVDIFCLVTNDADYVPLCHKLRESRKSIIGVGYPRAADAFIRACDTFIFIGREPAPTAPPPPPIKLPKPPKQPAAPPKPKSIDLLPLRDVVSRAILGAKRDPNGWVNLSSLGTSLLQVQKGFRVKQYGLGNLAKMLQTMPDLVEVRTHNGTQSVRLVTNGSHAPVVTADMTNLQQLIVRAFDSAPQEPDGWTDLSSLGTVLPELEAGFKTKTYGHSNLTKLLQSMPDFVDVEIRDGVRFARLRN